MSGVPVRVAAEERWLPAAVAAAAALCIGLPLWGLLVPGPFDWHVRQPAFWQGGLEALVLAAAVSAAFALGRGGASLALAALPAVLYLRRHAVDAAVLVDLVQLEITVGLGMALRRVLRLPRAQDATDYLQAFVAGFAAWSVCAWTLQALGAGSMKTMAWLAVALAIPACWARRKPLLAFLWQRVRARGRAERIGCGLLAAWLLVLYAHARTAIGFDSQWYGLRSPYVLVPGDSVYAPLGLTSPVYYFPKIYEVFLLPLYALRDPVAIKGFTIALLLPLLLCCRMLMRELGTPRRAELPLLLLVATLPALANTAIDAKPDVLSTVLVLAAACFGTVAARRRSGAAAAWMLACIALACAAKITAIPYAGIVLLATGAAWLRGAAVRAPADAAAWPPRYGWTVFALATLAALFVTARTLLLAGVPTIGPDPLLKLWHAIGFELKEPAGTLSWTAPPVWSDLPALLADWLFLPHRLEHIVVSWVGNVWLWLAAIALALAPWRPPQQWDRARLPLAALVATGFALAIGNRYQVRGGDGNYFVFALVPAIVWSGTAAFRRLAGRPRLTAAVLACIAAFVAFQAAYGFVSAAWTPGTRAFDLDFSKSPRGMRRTRAAMLDAAGLTRIAHVLGELPHATRVTGLVETTAQFWLPACFEDLLVVSYSRPGYTQDARSIRRFLRERGIAYFVMLREGVEPPPSVVVFPAMAEAARELAALPGVRRIDDRRYYLLDLSAVDPAVLDPHADARRAHALKLQRAPAAGERTPDAGRAVQNAESPAMRLNGNNGSSAPHNAASAALTRRPCRRSCERGAAPRRPSRRPAMRNATAIGKTKPK